MVKPGFQLVQNTVFLKLPEARSSSEQAPLSLLEEDNTSSPPQAPLPARGSTRHPWGERPFSGPSQIEQRLQRC